VKFLPILIRKLGYLFLIIGPIVEDEIFADLFLVELAVPLKMAEKEIAHLLFLYMCSFQLLV
jgi:hypothetical protein